MADAQEEMPKGNEERKCRKERGSPWEAAQYKKYNGGKNATEGNNRHPMPGKRRKGRKKGIPLAELAGTGHLGRLFGNRDARHRTQHAADPDVLAANH
jgi:hypothetical protein